MTLIVKTVTRLTLGFILLYGIYITLNGHTAPGGGFPGGVIVALSLVHVMLAYGKEVALKRVHAHVLRFSVSIAAVVFLYLAAASFSARGAGLTAFCKTMSACPLLNAETLIPICEMVVVGGGLFAIFIALVLLSKKDKDSE